jgi:NAD(P) transhydrogenase subunit alpha
MIVGLLKETAAGERRVALVPGALPALAKAGVEVVLESGAGLSAGFPDEAYVQKGARVLPSRAAVLEAARVVVQVRPVAAGASALEGLGRSHVVVGLMDPLSGAPILEALARRGEADTKRAARVSEFLRLASVARAPTKKP